MHQRQADTYFAAALEICRELGFRRVRAHALEGMACLAAKREGGEEHALALHAEAVALCRELELRPLLGEALGSMGLTLLAAGQPDDAKEALREALALRRESAGEAAGPREAAALALLGVINPAMVRVQEGARASERVTAHLLLCRAGGGDIHRVRARELLEFMWAHLPEPVRCARIAERLAATPPE